MASTLIQFDLLSESLLYKATHGGHQKIEKGKKEKKIEDN